MTLLSPHQGQPDRLPGCERDYKMAWYQWLTLFLLLYVLWRVAKVLHFYFRLWNIAMGGTSERRRVDANVRLYVYVCKTELLDEVSVNELYNFLIRMIHTDGNIKEFHSVLLSYKYVVVCRERKDGSMRGVSLLSVDRRELDGMKYTLIRLGLSFFQNYYRGGPLLYYVCAYHVFRELIYHPFTPLYMIGKSFSYKSYLVMCHTLPRVYPRYDVEMTEFARNILNKYGNASKAPNEIYDTDTFVLKREHTHLKEGVAVLNDKHLNDPHIKFFVEHNPGWVRGHQMIVAGEVRWWYLIRAMWRILRRVRRARKKRSKVTAGVIPKLLSNTAQCTLKLISGEHRIIT